MRKKHKVRIVWKQFWRLQQITAKARKHTWYFYQVVRKTSLQSVQETQSSHPFVIILALATNHGKSSQTHLVFLPSSSKDLTAKCARNTKFASFCNNLGACNKSVVRKTSLKSSQTHLVFLPSSSKDLTAKCARNTKFASFWNNFGPCNKSRQKLANTPGISTK